MKTQEDTKFVIKVSTVLFAPLCSQMITISWFAVSNRDVLSPQMSCVQTWRFNLIGLSPTAPVMVLKRFQVCANCCFSIGNTQSWQYSSTTKFFHISYTPTFSFFTWQETKRNFSIYEDSYRFHSQFLFDWKLNWFYSWLKKCYFYGTFIFCLIKSQCTCKTKMLSDLNLPTVSHFTSQLFWNPSCCILEK